MTSSGTETRERLVLDTSAFSRLRAGHEVAMTLIAAAERVLLPATVLGELEAGFELGRRSRENRIALAEFLDEPFVGTLPVDHETARAYGRVFAGLRERGTPLPIHDVWIAASALQAGAPLLTFDRDFERIPELDLLLLEV